MWGNIAIAFLLGKVSLIESLKGICEAIASGSGLTCLAKTILLYFLIFLKI